MIIKEYSDIRPLRLKWQQIYDSSPSILTPYASYDFVEPCIKKLGYLEKNRHLKAYVYFCSDEAKEIIIPLVKDKTKKILADLSSYTPTDYFEVISNSKDKKFIIDSLIEILHFNKGYSYQLAEINEKSLLYDIFYHGQKPSNVCVKINIPENNIYESIIDKHQRQNIRTAYNHIKRDNVKLSLQKYSVKDNFVIPHSVFNKCLYILFARRVSKRRNENWAKKLRIMFRTARMIVNRPLKDVFRNSDMAAIFVLSFNNKPIAFLMGGYNRDMSIFYVNVVSFSPAHNKYSPGIILIHHTVNRLIEEGVKIMDLTRGTEYYKYAMGGVEHYNYSFTLDYETLKQIL